MRLIKTWRCSGSLRHFGSFYGSTESALCSGYRGHSPSAGGSVSAELADFQNRLGAKGKYRERGDTRFDGGLGIYDAPEQWGPWTTAYFTHKWDVGPGEHGDFPAKWISDDGTSAHLVFSGDDCFSIRAARIHLHAR